MQLSHKPSAVSVAFDDPNVVASAGLVPAMALAGRVGLRELADQRLTVPTDRGANAGLKVCSLIAGMVAGADSIDDMGVLRHGGMTRLSEGAYAPSTLGSFLRSFTFGHVSQLHAVAARALIELAAQTPVLAGIEELAVVDVDDTVVEVHGYAKQGASYGYNRLRGLNALLATVSTPRAAPVVVAQRLRKGSSNSARGAGHLIGEALRTTRRLGGTGRVLVRADAAFHGRPLIGTAARAGAEVSVTMKLDPAVKAAIGRIDENAWTRIEYPNPNYDEQTRTWVSRAEVAETPYTLFADKKGGPITGRLVVRRVPEIHADPGQQGLFGCWRHHAFFTTTDPSHADTVTADKVHRAHAIIEQVHAGLKDSALAHLPSGRFAANSAWLALAVIAFNLTRAAGTLSGPDFTRATIGTIRRKLINVPARVATSARRLTLHLPRNWPWQTAWTEMFNRVADPPRAVPT